MWTLFFFIVWHVAKQEKTETPVSSDLNEWHNSSFLSETWTAKSNSSSSGSSLQQNTSSLWSINEPFSVHLVQGSRVNADEGMKVGVVSSGFFPTLQLNEVWHPLVYQYLNFSCTSGGEGLTCKWQGETWPRPHVSHNSSRRLVQSSKQEVGRAYLIFFFFFF